MSFLINPYRFASTGDPDWASVGLLLHCDGTDASTTFTDETGKTVTANGDAQIDTAQSKFGGASALFDGATDWLESAKSTDLEFGTGDFTIECFARLTSTASAQALFSYGKLTVVGNTDYAYALTHTPANGLVWAANDSGGAQTSIVTSNSMTVNTWHFIQVIRSSGTTKIYKDGTEIGSGADTKNYNTSASHLQLVGRRGSFSVAYWDGWIDELRITKGVVRSTTVPTAAFPGS